MEKAERKEKEFLFRRAEILAQAGKIFADKGFHNTTVAEIAGASGFAIGTLYQFFNSKDDLYTTMISEKLEQMYAEIEATAARPEGFSARLRELVQAHFRFAEDNPDFGRQFIRGVSTSMPEANAKLHAQMIGKRRQHLLYLETLMQQGIRERLLRAIEPRSMAQALQGMIHAFTFEWMLAPEKDALIGMIDTILKIFINGVSIRDES